MNRHGREDTGVRIILRKDSDATRLHVHSEGSPQRRRQVDRFVEFLRKQRSWPGRGEVTINVEKAQAVERAFTIPEAMTSYRQLQREAALQWFLPQFWWDGVSHMTQWQAMTTAAINQYLKEMTTSPQPTFFGRPVKDE